MARERDVGNSLAPHQVALAPCSRSQGSLASLGMDLSMFTDAGLEQVKGFRVVVVVGNVVQNESFEEERLSNSKEFSLLV